MPFSVLFLERRAVADDPNWKDQPNWGREIPLEIKVAIHPRTNGRIIVNYPGINETAEGPNDRYLKAAEIWQEHLGAVVRSENRDRLGFKYDKACRDDLRTVISYALANAEAISGRSHPTLYLAGYSAGASAVAAVAHEFPEIERILLVAPTGDAGQEAVRQGLEKYHGEIYMTLGEQDHMIKPGHRRKMYDLATHARFKDIIYVPDCDHYFRGACNEEIWPKMALWAFASDGKTNGELKTA